MEREKVTKRKKQAIATQRKIFNAALQLFHNKGHDQVTIDDICKKAGVSIGTFYVYFKSKDMVILEIFYMAQRTYAEYISNELVKYESPLEKLLLLARKIIQYTSDLGIDNVQVLYRSQINPTLDPSAAALRELQLTTLRQLIAEGQARGEIGAEYDAEHVTQLIYHCGHGIVYDWCLADGKFNLVQESEKLFGVVIKSLRPRNCK
jgi:AcrR family transcriptional regulator